MRNERGAALIISLMFLAFLTILGGSLLMTSTIDVWIGDNFQKGTQLLYVAEAGIEQGRENLRLALATTTNLLTTAAGGDLTLSTSTDLQTLIDSDDVPVIDGVPLSDASGRSIGTYYVWLRNDVADTMTSRTDSNDIVTLLSIAVIGDARKIIETTVSKGSFPSHAGGAHFEWSSDIRSGQFQQFRHQRPRRRRR